jgi:hypothetical protein
MTAKLIAKLIANSVANFVSIFARRLDRRDGWIIKAGAATAALLGTVVLVGAENAADTTASWQAPGQGGTFAEETSYSDPSGQLGLLNADGAFDVKGHPFFEPLGANGRACVTCHQPANAMSLSVDSIRARWRATGGKDPLFAAIDGSNCPNQPQQEESSHSLLLNRGLLRVFLPWPPRAADGTPVKPEFDIEVVRDPTGCNTDPVYGLDSQQSMISVYRRPRPVANMRYIGRTVGFPFNAKRLAMVLDRDPDSDRFAAMNMMADAREPTLRTQAANAALTHLQASAAPTKEQLDKIVAFEQQLYAAQVSDKIGGSLVEAGGPEGLGPRNLQHTPAVMLGDTFLNPVFKSFDQWRAQDTANSQQEFRASVARGSDVFFSRSFWIRDTTHINTVGLGNPIKRTCATCHNMSMMGLDAFAGWVDLGTTNLPWAREAMQSPWSNDKPELPLFKITCDPLARPHPFLGRVIYTQDPGRALISGKCYDVGSIVMGQFRGLAARAPYFSNGSASTLRDLVDFYDRRFNVGYSEREKQDLVNFLSVL